MATLIERRPRLLGFVVSVVIARIILSVLAATEEPDGLLPLLITVFLVIEVVMVWRAVQPVRGQAPRVPRASSIGLDRVLRAIERFGAPAIYATTVVCMAAYTVFRLQGSSRSAVLDTITAVRWAQLVLLLITLYLARRWEAGGATPEASGANPPAG